MFFGALRRLFNSALTRYNAPKQLFPFSYSVNTAYPHCAAHIYQSLSTHQTPSQHINYHVNLSNPQSPPANTTGARLPPVLAVTPPPSTRGGGRGEQLLTGRAAF